MPHRLPLALIIALAFAAHGIAGEVADAPEKVRPLLIGAGIPDVTLRDVDGKAVKLHDIAKQKPSIFVFYRGGWCPYCNRHLAALGTSHDQLKELGYQLVALSPDRPEKLNESIGKHKLPYTLLSDSEMAAAKGFGVAFQLDDATIKKYKEYKLDLQGYSGADHYYLPVPAVFIADTQGMIRFQHVDPNYKVRLSEGVLLAAAKAALAED